MNNYDEKSVKTLNYTYTENVNGVEKVKGKITDLSFDSRYSSNQFSTNLAFGIESKFIIPKIELNHTMLKVDSYIDNYDNNIDARTYNTLGGSMSVVLRNFLNFKFSNIRVSPELFGKFNLTLINENIEANGRLNGGISYEVDAGKIDEDSIEFGGNINFEIFSLINLSAYYNEIVGAEYSSQEFGLKANFLW